MKNKKAITIVNSITMIRVIGTFLLPFFAIILSPIGLTIYITSLLLTDALDGFLARKLNACTIFGSLLDQAADKILGIATLSILAWKYPIMLLPIFTEILIILVNSKYGIKGAHVTSSILGRIKTWLLGIAIVVGFCTLYANDIIVLFAAENNVSSMIRHLFEALIENPNLVMHSIAFVSLGMGAMVVLDYYLRAKHDLKEGNVPENLKIKWDKTLYKNLFSVEYYHKTKNQPLIKQLGKVVKK